MLNTQTFYSFSVFLLVLLLTCAELQADVSMAPQNVTELAELQHKLGTRLYNRKPDSVRAMPLKGLYEIVYDEQILYTDADARFIIRGEIIDLEGAGNLTAQARQRLAQQQAQANAKKLSQLALKDSLIFAADDEKAVVTILTEIGCPFCSRLHDERAHYLKQGVSLRYVFYSPEGEESEGYQQAQYVWCQADRALAFSQAMQGKRFAASICEHPLEKHAALTQQLQLAGTPVIFFADGTLWHGYYPAQKVIEKALQQP